MPSPSTTRFPWRCRRQQRGFERAVDDIGDDGICRQYLKIDVEVLLAGHAEARGIDEQAASRERSMAVLPVDHMHGRPEGLRQFLSAVARAVGNEDARGALVKEAVEDRPRRPAGTQHHHGPPPPIPVRGLHLEIDHEAVGIAVAGVQRTVGVEP
jgi:hypothetical protein